MCSKLRTPLANFAHHHCLQALESASGLHFFPRLPDASEAQGAGRRGTRLAARRPRKEPPRAGVLEHVGLIFLGYPYELAARLVCNFTVFKFVPELQPPQPCLPAALSMFLVPDICKFLQEYNYFLDAQPTEAEPAPGRRLLEEPKRKRGTDDIQSCSRCFGCAGLKLQGSELTAGHFCAQGGPGRSRPRQRMTPLCWRLSKVQLHLPRSTPCPATACSTSLCGWFATRLLPPNLLPCFRYVRRLSCRRVGHHSCVRPHKMCAASGGVLEANRARQDDIRTAAADC